MHKKHTMEILAQSNEQMSISSYNKFEFDQLRCLEEVPQKLNKYCTTWYPKEYILKISV